MQISRRRFVLGVSAAAGAAALGGLVGCARPADAGDPVGPGSEAVRIVEAQRRTAGQPVVAAHVTARPVQLDLGGPVVSTWAYDDTVPGPLIRARARDLLQVRVDNRLEVDTSVHFHGIAMRNDMDGVPAITQPPLAAGASFVYEFTAPDPGTYFYHSHIGLQLDRGLYGVAVVDDPNEPGNYDEEWILVLDDWIDGTGRTPDDVARALRMPAMDPSVMGEDRMGAMQPMGMGSGDPGAGFVAARAHR